MDSSLKDKLKALKNEEIIWIIYIGIIFLSFYSNNLERKFFIYNDLESKQKYQQTLIIIFTILLIIYTCFFKSSLESVNNLSFNDTEKKKSLTFLSLLASFFILISGIIYLYIALSDENIDVEIAFN